MSALNHPRCEVWVADCDAWDPALLLPTLTGEERARAERFHQARDRDRSIVRRALLRRLLGERLGVPPADVPLVTGPAGKPALAPVRDVERDGGGFNLARSGGVVVFAFRPACAAPPAGPPGREGVEVGIDLERIDGAARTVAELRRVATHFAAAESAHLAGLTDEDAATVFYRLWCAKEACLKCLGTGIGTGPALADVVVGMADDGSVRGATFRDGSQAWLVRCFTPCPGHVAAVAVAAGNGRDPTADGPVVDLRMLEPSAPPAEVSRVAAPPPGPARGAP